MYRIKSIVFVISLMIVCCSTNNNHQRINSPISNYFQYSFDLTEIESKYNTASCKIENGLLSIFAFKKSTLEEYFILVDLAMKKVISEIKSPIQSYHIQATNDGKYWYLIDQPNGKIIYKMDLKGNVVSEMPFPHDGTPFDNIIAFDDKLIGLSGLIGDLSILNLNDLNTSTLFKDHGYCSSHVSHPLDTTSNLFLVGYGEQQEKIDFCSINRRNERLWTYSVSGRCYEFKPIFMLNYQRYFLFNKDNRITCLDKQTGKLVWEIELNHFIDYVRQEGNKLITYSTINLLPDAPAYSCKSQINCIDLEKQKIAWTYDFDPHGCGTILLSKDSVLLHNTYKLSIVDKNKGILTNEITIAHNPNLGYSLDNIVDVRTGKNYIDYQETIRSDVFWKRHQTIRIIYWN